MKHDYKILLIGNLYNNHMVRFVKNLKKHNPLAQIEGFVIKDSKKEIEEEYISCFNEFYEAEFSHTFKGIIGIQSLEIIYNLRKHFSFFSQNKHYDIVNIQYPTYILNYILSDIRAVTNKIVLTPWGSDVYRIGKKKRDILKNVYKAADYVTGHGDRFTKDYMRIFGVPSSKIASADIGSDTIDYIIDHRDKISSNEAKRLLNIKDSYVITCGYNASPAQQHLEIIKALGTIRNQLPTNLVLLFPMTYQKDCNYINLIKNEVKQNNFKSLFFEDYLDLEHLFFIRQATDLFIHVQTTDANCVTIKEYLILGKNIINGGWLEYDEFENGPQCPYYKINSMDDLSKTIVMAYNSGSSNICDRIVTQAEKSGWRNSIIEWNDLFEKIS